jgi:hypothetical protein
MRTFLWAAVFLLISGCLVAQDDWKGAGADFATWPLFQAGKGERSRAGCPSLNESLLVSVVIPALLAALVGGSRVPFVIPHADVRLEIRLVVRAQTTLLSLRPAN